MPKLNEICGRKTVELPISKVKVTLKAAATYQDVMNIQSLIAENKENPERSNYPMVAITFLDWDLEDEQGIAAFTEENFRQLPMKDVDALFKAMMDSAKLSDNDEKNSSEA